MAIPKPNAPTRLESSETADIAPFTSLADITRHLTTGLRATEGEVSGPLRIPMLEELSASLQVIPELQPFLTAAGVLANATIFTLCAQMVNAGLCAETYRRAANPLPTEPDGIPASLTAGLLACRSEYASQASSEPPSGEPEDDPTAAVIAEAMRFHRLFSVERDDLRRAELSETPADAELALRNFAARMFRAGQLATL